MVGYKYIYVLLLSVLVYSVPVTYEVSIAS